MNWLTHHISEILLAVLFAAIFDIVRIGSFVRAGIRHAGNKLAERSISRLKKRIAEQERYRNDVQSYAESDKALYLATLRFVVLILMLMCMAGAIVIVGPEIALPAYPLLALTALAVAFLGAMSAVRMTSWDTKSKILEVAKRNKEIMALKTKLDAKQRNE